ncbi:MAG TPA: CBS domain-containing protein [Acidimicrobiales bacterium]|jgi:CBS domain-containing protein|nr:CBS domain-containing protein [Acidimicrobiales bacterium]
MAQSIGEVMTHTTRTLETDATVQQAAQVMAEDDIGAVIVCRDGRVAGIVTDRDITVRATAQGKGTETTLGDVCSGDVVTLSPSDTVGDAVQIMREKAVRRVPVVEGDKPVGIVSIGDLAIERDARSALADISAAEGNT